MPEFYIGTAGWSYKDWVPSFYPKSQSAKFDWLQFYSLFFNCVEINSTYYAYVAPKTAQGWVNKTETRDNFCFTVKLHQDFTHIRKYGNNNINAMKETLNILNSAGRLGSILMQFPFSFQFNSSTADYISSLADVFAEYKIIAEVRHQSWMNKEAFEQYAEKNISFCSIDQPQIGKSIKFEPVITSDTLYLRFHGRNREEWFKSISNFNKPQTAETQNERYRYLYSPGELLEISEVIKRLREKVKDIYVIMNNHPGGNAIANAFELIHFLEERAKVKIPETTTSAFPRLTAISSN